MINHNETRGRKKKKKKSVVTGRSGGQDPLFMPCPLFFKSNLQFDLVLWTSNLSKKIINSSFYKQVCQNIVLNSQLIRVQLIPDLKVNLCRLILFGPNFSSVDHPFAKEDKKVVRSHSISSLCTKHSHQKQSWVHHCFPWLFLPSSGHDTEPQWKHYIPRSWIKSRDTGCINNCALFSICKVWRGNVYC